MLLYFFLLKGSFFREVMLPALARAYRERTFVPCRDLCRFLLAEHTDVPPDALIHAILAGLPFERVFWHGLVGECLVHGAHEIPRLQTAPDALCRILAPDRQEQAETPRAQYAPIRQALFGTRDLLFGGGYYRPDHAGLNDAGDVDRLAAFLQAIDPSAWSPWDLEGLADCVTQEQRAEELAYVRDWWPSLVGLYQNARDHDLVVVCEKI